MDCQPRSVHSLLLKNSLDPSGNLDALNKNKVINENTGYYHKLLTTVAWPADCQSDVEMH